MSLRKASCRLLLVLCTVLPMTDAAFAGEPLFDFSKSTAGWRLSQVGPNTAAKLEHRAETTPLGPGSLAMDVKLPGVGCAEVPLLDPARRKGVSWAGAARLRYAVKIPSDAPDDVQAMVFVKDGTMCYYQSIRKMPLRRGKWEVIEVDLRPFNLDWEVSGHFKPWDGYVLHEVLAFGVKLQSRKPFEGTVLVGPFALDRSPEAEGAQATSIQNLRTNTNLVRRYEMFEVSFDLDRYYVNPFDPEDVDVQGVFIAPSGRAVSVPGFFYQNYIREKVQLQERLIPIGRPHWKVRFTPAEAGLYRYYVKIEDGASSRTGLLSFRCIDGTSHGFVRICKDKRHFEFTDGTYFYPIGHNIAGDGDERSASGLGFVPIWGEGTFAYDRYLRRMSDAGENFCRLWFSYWSLGLDWTRKISLDPAGEDRSAPQTYDASQYGGIGRYNLKHAWKLDHIVNTCSKCNIYLMLLFTGHVEISAEYESEWAGSPYNRANGGPIPHPAAWYTDELVRKYYENRLRYIAARWGYSTNVVAWELLNEPDLARYYPQVVPQASAWVKHMLQYIKKQDHSPHLATSGLYWHRKAWASTIMGLPEVDFNTAHIFDSNLGPQLLADVLTLTKQYDRVFLATEADVTPFAQNPSLTERSMHLALWSSYCMPYAGAAMSWWWVFIDQHDLYFHFRALSRFAQGEDRRAMQLKPTNVIARTVPEAGARSLAGYCMQGPGYACFWVYSPVAFSSAGCWRKQPALGANATLQNVSDAEYDVEIWDTYKGQLIEKKRYAAKGGRLEIPLPPFELDIACKVRIVESKPEEEVGPDAAAGKAEQ